MPAGKIPLKIVNCKNHSNYNLRVTPFLNVLYTVASIIMTVFLCTFDGAKQLYTRELSRRIRIVAIFCNFAQVFVSLELNGGQIGHTL